MIDLPSLPQTGIYNTVLISTLPRPDGRDLLSGFGGVRLFKIRFRDLGLENGSGKLTAILVTRPEESTMTKEAAFNYPWSKSLLVEQAMISMATQNITVP